MSLRIRQIVKGIGQRRALPSLRASRRLNAALLAILTLAFVAGCGTGSGQPNTLVDVPTSAPTAIAQPTATPTPKPTDLATEPVATPTLAPTATPTAAPTLAPTPKATAAPTPKATKAPAFYKPPGWDGHSDVNCKDFDTHAHAQSFFVGTGGTKTYDPYGLDADSDGIACESLP